MIPLLLADAQPITFVVTNEVRVVGTFAFAVIVSLGGLVVYLLKQQLSETKTMRGALMGLVGTVAGTTTRLDAAEERIDDHEERIRDLESSGRERRAAGGT